MEENITFLHAKCVNTAIEMLEKHPYFILEELLLPMEGVTVPVLSCYEDHIKYHDVCFIGAFHPRNGEHKSTRFGLIVTKVSDEHFQIALGEMDMQYHITRLLDSRVMSNYDTPVHVITLLFTTLCREMEFALDYGWKSYRIPKEWLKSYHKAIKRFLPEVFEREWRDPAFYPNGTVVELVCCLSDGLSGDVVVMGVAEYGPDNYILRTDRYAGTKYDHIDLRHSVNTGHVRRIVKRGKGGVSSVSAAEFLYQKETADTLTTTTPFYSCQKKAWAGVFKDITSTKRSWIGGGYDLVTDYVLAFKPERFTFSNIYQFDYARFMRAVRESEYGWGSSRRISKKRFKKQLKRIHCYLGKLREAVLEDHRENERYQIDLDSY